ncbi:MAG: hypothetical protein WCE30_10835 [Mycobacterium sp.]
MMGYMKAIASELESYWDGGDEHGGYTVWSRELPDRNLAIIAEGYGTARLIVSHETIGQYQTVAEAVLDAGPIARAILSAQMTGWAE